MSRILWARNVGSIDLQAVEQDDGSVTIEARITIAGSFTIDARQREAYMQHDPIYDDIVPTLVHHMRNEAHKVATEKEG